MVRKAIDLVQARRGPHRLHDKLIAMDTPADESALAPSQYITGFRDLVGVAPIQKQYKMDS
jgi:hypothetical protein